MSDLSKSYLARPGRTPRCLTYALVLLAVDGAFGRDELKGIGASARDRKATINRLLLDGVVNIVETPLGFLAEAMDVTGDIAAIRKARSVAREPMSKAALEVSLLGDGIRDREARGIVRALQACGRLVEPPGQFGKLVWVDPLPFEGAFDEAPAPPTPFADKVFDALGLSPGTATELTSRLEGKSYQSVYTAVQRLLRYGRISLVPNVPGRVYAQKGREVVLTEHGLMYADVYRGEA